MSIKTRAVAKYSGTKSPVHAPAAGGWLAIDGRAFHANDYRRAAELLKSLRKDRGGKAKNVHQQERVDMLAAAMAAVFEADSHEFGVPFSPGYFVAGTR
jgi:hypothetical protein